MNTPAHLERARDTVSGKGHRHFGRSSAYLTIVLYGYVQMQIVYAHVHGDERWRHCPSLSTEVSPFYL